MRVTAKILLDQRRLRKKDSAFPIKLSVIFKRKPKQYPTIYRLSKSEYDKLPASHISSELKEIKTDLDNLLTDVRNYLRNIDEFTFAEFERDFVADCKILTSKEQLPIPEKGNIDFDFLPYYSRFPILTEEHPHAQSISVVYQAYIKKLIQQKRIGTALSYHASYCMIKQFSGNVRFKDITNDYLIKFENWRYEKGVTRSTVGINLRPLRAMFNEADEMGIIKKAKCYPFGKKRYKIPGSRNIKKALEQDDIKMFYYHEPDDILERKARDFWIFIYFCNGINPMDLAYLKFSNIDGEYLSFIRAKTELTINEEVKPVVVYVNEDMRNIINRWGNSEIGPDNFLFPIINSGDTELEAYDAIRYFTSMINTGMKKIAKRLGFAKKISVIVARHSFATQLKKRGISTEYIQESLGHKDKSTTENYLDSFPNEIKKENADLLNDFKKIDNEPNSHPSKLVSMKDFIDVKVSKDEVNLTSGKPYL